MSRRADQIPTKRSTGILIQRKNSRAGYVTIIYRNRTELYKLERTYNNTDAKKINDSTFDPYNEIEMEKGNGSRRVYGNKEKEIVILRGDNKE